MQTWSRGSDAFKTKCQNKDKEEIIPVTIVGARQGGLSISNF